MMASDAECDFLTAAECCKILRCSLRKLDRDRASRVGCPYFRLGGKIFYRRKDIFAYIESCRRGTPEQGKSDGTGKD